MKIVRQGGCHTTARLVVHAVSHLLLHCIDRISFHVLDKVVDPRGHQPAAASFHRHSDSLDHNVCQRAAQDRGQGQLDGAGVCDVSTFDLQHPSVTATSSFHPAQLHLELASDFDNGGS